MRFIRHILLAGVVLTLSVLSGCDDGPVPNHSYFLRYFGQDGFQTCSDVEVDSQGNFYLLGTSGTVVDDPDASLFVVKADPSGVALWIKTFAPTEFGNVAGTGVQARDLELISDGTLVVTGNLYVSPTDRNIFVAKINRETGEMLRGNSFSPYNNEGVSDTETHDDEAYTITEITGDSTGFLIAGYSNNLSPSSGQTRHLRDGIHVRLNDNLTMLPRGSWKQVLNQGYVSVETKIVQLDAASFLSFGYGSPSDASTEVSFTASTINASGVPTPVLTNGNTFGTANADERLGSVCLLSGNGINNTYFMLGITTPAGAVPSSQLFAASVVQSVESGQQVLNPSALPLTATFPGLGLRTPGSYYTSCVASVSGGILVLTNENTNGDMNWLLVKLATDGSQLWQKAIKFGGEGNDFAGSVRELPDGKIIISGTFTLNSKTGETKMVLMKLNRMGQLAD